MRHRKKISKLNRTSAHRKALMRNLLDSLISQGRIETTIAKAKELKRFADNFFSKVRKNDLNAKKRAGRYLKTRESFKKLFEEDFIDFLNSRNGGYVRVVRSGIRPGDTAQLAIIELTGKYEPETKKPEEEVRGSKKTMNSEELITAPFQSAGQVVNSEEKEKKEEVSEEGKTEEEKTIDNGQLTIDNEEKPEEITTEDTPSSHSEDLADYSNPDLKREESITTETTEKEEVGGMPSTNLVRGELEVSEEGKTEEEKIEEKPEEITTEDTEKEEEINPEAEPPSENPEEKE